MFFLSFVFVCSGFGGVYETEGVVENRQKRKGRNKRVLNSRFVTVAQTIKYLRKGRSRKKGKTCAAGEFLKFSLMYVVIFIDFGK